MAGETRGKIHAVDFSSVRHDIESEIERAAPDEFYFGVVQLGINAGHTAAENFGALARRLSPNRRKPGPRPPKSPPPHRPRLSPAARNPSRIPLRRSGRAPCL